MLSPDERYLLGRAPIELTFVSANTALIAAANKLRREGLATLDYPDLPAGQSARVRVMITSAGAEAYARATAS